MEKLYLIWWIIIWFIVGYLIWKIIKHTELRKQRKMSVKKSRSIILWEVAEKITPILPNLPYHTKDMNFLWKWVDYIIFDGLSEWNLKQIVFLEVKSWKSRQNKNEKDIENIIKSKKIKYEILKV